MNGWMDGRMGEWVNGWMGEWVNGWRGEGVNRWIDRINIFIFYKHLTAFTL